MVYNLQSLTQTDVIQVPLVGAEQVAKKRLFSLRGLVVLLAILALTISLASRVVHVSFSHGTTIHSPSAQSKIQHRDKDASEFVSPIATFSLLCVAEPSDKPAAIESKCVQPHYNSLYTRPPPVS